MITNIRLQNFRSYRDSSFEFSDGVNIVVGPNATGKTNLIEAIYVISRNNSFRVRDQDLISFGADWLRIDSYISDTNRVLKIIKKEDKIEKLTIVDDKEYKRLPKSQYFPTVLFEPNQLLILSGGPEGRRNFMDELLAQGNPTHLEALNKYRRVLLQRNSLLKIGKKNDGQFFVWNTRLVELASEIIKNRTEIITKINKSISNIYSDVAGKKHQVELEYISICNVNNYGSDLLKRLEHDIDKDIMRGFTSCGPHRDDIKVSINKNDASIAASRGEARTMLLALKTFEILELEKQGNYKPILLLDDVFSELDGLRRNKLTSYFKKYQSFITTTDADIVSHQLSEHSKLIAL